MYPIFLAFFPLHLHVTACNAVSLVTGPTRLFLCEITLLPRDYRDRPRGENGFSHYAIMQIPLKSNRGRARYWETVAQKRRRREDRDRDRITEETQGKTEGGKKCEGRKELSDNAEGSAELW